MAIKSKKQSLVFPNAKLWHEVPLPPLQELRPTSTSARNHDDPDLKIKLPAHKVSEVYAKAQRLHELDCKNYEASSTSRSESEFLTTLMKTGTTADKLSAITLVIQESPVHTFALLKEQMVHGMARKKSRKEALMALDGIKDLLVSTVLPDRKLVYFEDRPILHPDAQPIHLIAWWFEDALKKLYFDFLKLLEELLHDPLVYVKAKVLQMVYELLNSKPEEEANNLLLLTNKMGDLDRKVSSTAAFLLSKLLTQHPLMASIVVKEVERFIFRQNAAKARYVALTFLNQIVLTKRNPSLAISLVQIYFNVFDQLYQGKGETTAGVDKLPDKKSGKENAKKTHTKSKKAVKGESPQEAAVASKMVSAILTGINRAYPFVTMDDATLDSHVNKIFSLVYTGSFNTSVQALTLIFHVQSNRLTMADRYYRALYATVLDPRLTLHPSTHPLYLNLLYKSLSLDASMPRLSAFFKRACQVCVGGGADAGFVCGMLWMMGVLLEEKPGLSWMLANSSLNGDDDIEESEALYDAVKRDPMYCHAQSTLLWDLTPLVHHYHPTVSLYAERILSGSPLSSLLPKSSSKLGNSGYDPLQNHTLTKFLDKFVVKNPKKLAHAALHEASCLGERTSTDADARPVTVTKPKSLWRGISAMQPRPGGFIKEEGLFTGRRAKHAASANSATRGVVGVEVEEEFYTPIISKKSSLAMANGGGNGDIDVRRDAEELDDADFDEAITASAGQFAAQLKEDADDDDGANDDFEGYADDREDDIDSDDVSATESNEETKGKILESDDFDSADDDMALALGGDDDNVDDHDQNALAGVTDEPSTVGAKEDSLSKRKKVKRSLLTSRLASRGFSQSVIETVLSGGKEKRKAHSVLDNGAFASADDFEDLLEYESDDAHEDDDDKVNEKNVPVKKPVPASCERAEVKAKSRAAQPRKKIRKH